MSGNSKPGKKAREARFAKGEVVFAFHPLDLDESRMHVGRVVEVLSPNSSDRAYALHFTGFQWRDRTMEVVPEDAMRKYTPAEIEKQRLVLLAKAKMVPTPGSSSSTLNANGEEAEEGSENTAPTTESSVPEAQANIQQGKAAVKIPAVKQFSIPLTPIKLIKHDYAAGPAGKKFTALPVTDLIASLRKGRQGQVRTVIYPQPSGENFSIQPALTNGTVKARAVGVPMAGSGRGTAPAAVPNGFGSVASTSAQALKKYAAKLKAAGTENGGASTSAAAGSNGRKSGKKVTATKGKDAGTPPVIPDMSGITVPKAKARSAPTEQPLLKPPIGPPRSTMKAPRPTPTLQYYMWNTLISPTLDLSLPESLKAVLSHDRSVVMAKGRARKLHLIPAAIPVDRILHVFAEGTENEERATVFIDGVMTFFDRILGLQLLYSSEKAQYVQVIQDSKAGRTEEEIIESPPKMSRIYGGIHLLRFFANVETNRAMAAFFSGMDNYTKHLIQVHFNLFVAFFERNLETYVHDGTYRTCRN